MSKTYIGLDVGGTNIEGGLVSDQGKILHLAKHRTENHLGKARVAQNTIEVIQKLLAYSKNCAGIAIGWPSIANVDLTSSAIEKILKKKFRIPILMNNDANFFALAESLVGQGKKYNIVLGVTHGTGIGAGLIINQKIYAGKGGASELGHMMINFNGPKCACGNPGCFEEYGGSRSIHRLARKYKASKIGGQDLELLARRGNKAALKVWQEFGQYVGIGLANAINVYDPEIIILGGKISRAYRFFKNAMHKEIKKRSLLKACPIKVSKMNNAAIVGAALYAKQYAKK